MLTGTGIAVVLVQLFSGHANAAVMLIGVALASPAAYGHIQALLGTSGDSPASPPSPPPASSPSSSPQESARD